MSATVNCHYHSFNQRAIYLSRQQNPRIKRTRNRILAVIGTICFLAFISVDSRNMKSEMQTEQSLYCDMVALHKTDVSLGWPDFKNIYKKACQKK